MGSPSGTIKRLGSNIEQNAQNVANNLARISKGDFNNLGSTLLYNYAVAASGGLANPNEIKNLTGETNVDRFTREQETRAKNEEANAAAAVQAEQIRQVESTLAGIVGAKKRQPGRAQTLIGSRPSNTLLTFTE